MVCIFRGYVMVCIIRGYVMACNSRGSVKHLCALFQDKYW